MEPSSPGTATTSEPSKIPAFPLMRFFLVSFLCVASFSDARELRRARDDPCAPTEVRKKQIEGNVPEKTASIFRVFLLPRVAFLFFFCRE